MLKRFEIVQPKEKSVAQPDTEKSEESENIETVDSDTTPHAKLHVEFKEPELVEEPVKEVALPPTKVILLFSKFTYFNT